MNKMQTTNTMPQYLYMPLPNGEADVFIYKALEETEDGYIYMTNEFRTRLSESAIASNPYDYLDYEASNTITEQTLEMRVMELEKQLADLTYTFCQLSENVIEVIKKDDSNLPQGDFVNPIQIPKDGIVVEVGKFYYVDDKSTPHEAIQNAFIMQEDFDDKEWFDFM